MAENKTTKQNKKRTTNNNIDLGTDKLNYKQKLIAKHVIRKRKKLIKKLKKNTKDEEKLKTNLIEEIDSMQEYIDLYEDDGKTIMTKESLEKKETTELETIMEDIIEHIKKII